MTTMTEIRPLLDEVSVHFRGKPALKRLSGDFESGTVTALIGADGAGKSTVLRLLAGRVRPSAGTMVGIPPLRNQIGYQPADSGVWQNLSVQENLEFVASAYGMSAEQGRSRADFLLRIAGLERVTDRLAGHLSGGMRQKLGVVLATLHRPQLVLLDEPTTGVDPISRAELWSLIAGAAAEGATVVFATTYLDEAERANKLFLLGDGELLASGTPDQVIADTPGIVWQAPLSLESASEQLLSPAGWRKADTIYRWTPPGDSGPDGFEPAPGELENTSIALLLNQGDTAVISQPAHSPRTKGPGAVRRNSSQIGITQEVLVQARGVCRNFASFEALKDVSLEVKQGEIVGLIGGNGAGKTTLMRILLGLDTPTGGTTSLFGAAPSMVGRRRIGYVAQGLGLYPSLSALENLEFSAAVQGASIPAEAKEFARSFGHHPVSTLPLGARRVLAYLAASVHNPGLLVLDEPTSGMDSLTRADLWCRLRSRADQGTGVLVTTHYMQEAAQCDRLLILADGEIVTRGTVDEISGRHRCLRVETSRWKEAFEILRGNGVPVLLHGRSLRLPGTEADHVQKLLVALGDDVTISTTSATLEEAMLLSSTGGSSRSHI